MSNISISYNDKTKKTELFYKNELTLFQEGDKTEVEMVDILNGYVLSGLDELEKSIKHLRDNLTPQTNKSALEELVKELKELAEMKQEIDTLQSKTNHQI